jgi:hypothetical protein
MNIVVSTTKVNKGIDRIMSTERERSINRIDKEQL